MRKIIIVILFITTKSFSQNIVESNTIISVNNDICKNLIDVKIIDNKGLFISTNYLPGKLIIDNDALKTFDKENDIICLEITVPEFNNDKIFYKIYFINNIKFKLLFSDYFILKIFDLRDKKINKKYFPLNGKDFTFEFESPIENLKRAYRN